MVQIGEFFHLIHVVNDEDEVDAFYDDLFSPQRFAPRQWSDHEKRWASLSMVSDLMLEVIEPSRQVAHEHAPLSRFHRRFGQHLHSFAWYVDVDDVRPMFERLRAAGIRIAQPGGGFFPDGDIDPGLTIFTHPKDTFGQIEFEGKRDHWKEVDPRFQPDWTAAPWREGPLGIQRMSHMTSVVRDMSSARAFYEGVLEGRVFHTETSHGAERGFVLVGTDTVIELARPIDAASRLAADLDANGELPHSVSFRVCDLAAVERHVDKLGVRVADRNETSLTLDPADCFGALWSFTETSVPGDPRAE